MSAPVSRGTTATYPIPSRHASLDNKTSREAATRQGDSSASTSPDSTQDSTALPSTQVTSASNDPEKGPRTIHTEHDPNVVGFESDHDPLNAQNWSPKKKWSLVALLAVMTLVT